MTISHRAYLGNTFFSAPGAAAHGLTIDGADYSFIPYFQAGKMIVVSEWTNGDAKGCNVEILPVTEARARYASITSKGATKCAAKRTVWGHDYNGYSSFDAEKIAAVPETDIDVRWANADKTAPAGVTYGVNIG